MDIDRLISSRARALATSGIRKVFELGATLTDPINLSIPPPHSPAPAPIKAASYTLLTTPTDSRGHR